MIRTVKIDTDLLDTWLDEGRIDQEGQTVVIYCPDRTCAATLAECLRTELLPGFYSKRSRSS